MNPIRLFLIAASCFMSMSAAAQWQWLDQSGRKVFSDRAPPADVLEKNILKRPVGQSKVVPPASAASPEAGEAGTPTATAGASLPQLSGVDKELADKKKKAEQAETAKRQADDEKRRLARADNCARARQAKATFDSGVRMARTNDKGEREIMDDTARSAETKRIQTIIDADCK